MSAANQVGSQPLDGVLSATAPLGRAAEGTAEALVGGHYLLGARLGRGGEGDTFRAIDQSSGSAVAVKIFRETSTTVVDRVRREFERLMGMEHPGVVRALDVGRHDGRLFLVTALAEGTSLGALAAVEDDERRRALFVKAARQLTEAVAFLHGRGVVHGDIAPENVRMTADGQCVLIDLGATAGTSTGGAVGTIGFAAPEALIGKLSAASDLFSVGATLFQAWTGSAPFGLGAESVGKMLSTEAPIFSSVRPGLPPRWDVLIGGLLRRMPEERFSSARAVLRQLALLEVNPEAAGGSGIATGADVDPEAAGLLPPHPAGDPLAGIFVGRTAERLLLEQAFEALAEGGSSHAVIALVGGEGTGRRTLLELALRDLAIAQLAEPGPPPLSTFRGSLAGLASWLGIAAAPRSEGSAEQMENDPVRVRQRRFAAIAARIEQCSAGTPLLIALTAGVDEEAFAGFMGGAPGSGRALVVLPAHVALAAVAALDLPLPPLSSDDVQTLIARAWGEPAPAAATARVSAATGGHAASVAATARQLVAALRRGEGDTFVARADLALENVLEESFRALPRGAREQVARIALQLGPAHHPGEEGGDHPQSDDGGQGADAARAVGWLDADGVRLPSSIHHAVFRRLFLHPDVRAVAQRALETPLHLSPAARALSLEVEGQVDEAARAYLSAADASARREVCTPEEGAGIAPAPGEAFWLGEAARLVPGSLNGDQRTTLATTLVLQGRTDEALAVLDLAAIAPPAGSRFPADASASPRPISASVVLATAERLRLVERKAWVLGRLGQLEAAYQLLRDALATAPPDAPPGVVASLLARLARLLVSLGRFQEAAATAAAGSGSAASTAPVGALDALILARAYAGDVDGARALLALWPVEEDRLSPGGKGGTGTLERQLLGTRRSYIAALLDQLAGDLLKGLEGYRRALVQAESSGDVHTVAAIALNLGALAAEAGRYEEALLTQDRAIRELGRLGASTELGTALFNAAMTLLELGDLAGARCVMARLRDQSGRLSGAGRGSALTYLDAEMALRQGDETRALALFSDASAADGLDGAMAAGTGRAAVLARVDLLARAQRFEASTLLDHLDGASAGGGSNPRAAAEVRLARARVAMWAPQLDVGFALELAKQVREDAAAADREGRRPRAWRAALAAARLFHRAAAIADAAAQIQIAKRLLQEIRMSTPIDHRAGIDQDPDARFLRELTRLSAGHDDGGARGSRAEDRLRRLLRINKRLNGELRLPRLLELIMDTIIELTEAERGFILLEDEKGELVVKVARNIDQQTLETGAFDLSRSIARQAAAGGIPIVTIDAAGDPRFSQALSVSDLHLRSVLAVPLQTKGRAVGTLYVDNRLRKGAFGDDDVQLVLDFAEQAGIAIENARLLSELRRRERQIEVLNRRLQSELAVRKEELVGMKQELRENREALAVRYDYRNIIGRTPRMLELFRLLDRLTDTALPVVIQGESGTGKELVARALHFNGPRRDRPFVSENCAAIPETLLESTLFGAVRGAYTGADHDSRGLFEVADGGTLFLDEVGEMSPAMQGKLLRVLQTGELRRVGSERTRTVQVRVVAATNRDLGRMVEEGRFRQDLFFRLCVAPIALPALRERRDDIPAIVEHVLNKLAVAAKTSPKRVTATALIRLASYRWPGNVRELENELMRASALCDGAIDVRDLSPHVAGDADTALTTLDDPDNLALKPRVERLERALVREALGRSGGNQTRAAVALGLSRFGLQKKMQRYQIG